MPKKKRLIPSNPTARERRQIARYGTTWANLSPREQWYQRHKVRSRGKPVNAYIAYPKPPRCYGDWEDDACGVCGQTYDSFRAKADWYEGVELVKQAAARERVRGGGYRSRGAVLYAMSVIKRQDFYMRHELGCCLPAMEFMELWNDPRTTNFFPYPKIVWYLSRYGLQDGKSEANVLEADQILAIIDEAIANEATKLRDFPKGLKERIRKLEVKYKYKNWWRTMTRETNGTGEFLKQPGTVFLEEFLPTTDDTDYSIGDIPF